MYEYGTQRRNLFTEDGVRMLTKIRDNAKRLLDSAGAFMSCQAWSGVSGNSWDMLAALDYLVENEEIREITGSEVAGQHRVFVATRLP